METEQYEHEIGLFFRDRVSFICFHKEFFYFVCIKNHLNMFISSMNDNDSGNSTKLLDVMKSPQNRKAIGVFSKLWCGQLPNRFHRAWRQIKCKNYREKVLKDALEPWARKQFGLG